jgi:hypothetical protein
MEELYHIYPLAAQAWRHRVARTFTTLFSLDWNEVSRFSGKKAHFVGFSACFAPAPRILWFSVFVLPNINVQKMSLMWSTKYLLDRIGCIGWLYKSKATHQALDDNPFTSTLLVEILSSATARSLTVMGFLIGSFAEKQRVEITSLCGRCQCDATDAAS